MKKFHFKSSVSQEESPTLLRLERRHTLMNVDNVSDERQRMAAPVTRPNNVELQDLGKSSEGSSMKRRVQAKLSRDKISSECSPASSVVITDNDLSSSWIYKKAALACNDTFESNQSDQISPLLAPRSIRERSRSPKSYLPDRKTVPVAKRAQTWSTCCWLFTILLFVFISSLGIMSAIGGVVYLEVFSSEKPAVDLAGKVPLVYKSVRRPSEPIDRDGHLMTEEAVEFTLPHPRETSTSKLSDTDVLNEDTLASSESNKGRGRLLDENRRDFESNFGDDLRDRNERHPLDHIVERPMSRLNISEERISEIFSFLSQDKSSKDSEKVDSFEQGDNNNFNHDSSKHEQNNDPLFRNVDAHIASENSIERQNQYTIALIENNIIDSKTKSKDSEAELKDTDSTSSYLLKEIQDSTPVSDQNLASSPKQSFAPVAFSQELDVKPSDTFSKKFISNLDFVNTTIDFDHEAIQEFSSFVPIDTKSQTVNISLNNVLSEPQHENSHSRTENSEIDPAVSITQYSEDFNADTSDNKSDVPETISMISHSNSELPSNLGTSDARTTKDFHAVASVLETRTSDSLLKADLVTSPVKDVMDPTSPAPNFEAGLSEAHLISPNNPLSHDVHAESSVTRDGNLLLQHLENRNSQDEFRGIHIDVTQKPNDDPQSIKNPEPFVITGVASTAPLELFRRLEQPAVDPHSNQRNFLAMQSSLADAVKHLQHLHPTDQFPASRIQSINERNRLRNQHSPRRPNIRTQSSFSDEAALERIRYLERLRALMFDNA